MAKPSWICTVLTQFSLCFALYLVLNVGQPQKPLHRSESRSLDVYFISVRGGFRPLHHQTHLLNQMEKAAKMYKVSFVINISELGEDDPLMQNGTQHSWSEEIPWYTTRASQGHETVNFLKKIKMPYGKTLAVIGVDTGSLPDVMHMGSTTGAKSNQLHWLTRTLETTNSSWRIVVGFHPLVTCEENKDQIVTKKIYEPLHHVFMQFGVNAYLSRVGCTEYARQGSVSYIGNPGLVEDEPYLASAFREKMSNGFLLHRVGPLEIVTYFVNSSGEAVFKSVLHHRGKDVM